MNHESDQDQNAEKKFTLSRRFARETAVQFLFSQAFDQNFKAADFQSFCEHFHYAYSSFAAGLIEGTLKALNEIDRLIATLSTNWRIERMSKMDLTILRLSIYEISYCPDIPKAVTINEAIELAKKFGAEDSASFVNGILDKLSKPE